MSGAQVELIVQLPQDRYWAAAEATRFALRAGLETADARRLALALAELVSNATTHARGATVMLEIEAQLHPAVRVTVDDVGPGIADPELALRDGWSEQRWLTPDVPLSERRGLGTGLGAVARLVDALHIARTPRGTRVVCRVGSRPPR